MLIITCSIEACDRKAVARGWCNLHWKRWKNHGDANYQRPGFWERVEKSGHHGCWLWTGARRGRDELQYGCLWFRGRHDSAHRVAWILTHGEIPEIEDSDGHGTCVLHKCDTPLCVNPEHLFLGTHLQNMQDKLAKKRDNVRNKSRCINGHARTTQNSWRDPRRGARHCRICHRIQEQHRRQRLRTKRNEEQRTF